jgi:GAF domain-containing protein
MSDEHMSRGSSRQGTDGSAPDDADDHRQMHAFAELARLTVNADPPEQTLRRVAELAKRTLGKVEDVSLTLIERGHPRSVVFTGPLAVQLDERQYELGFGPCLDAAKTGQTLVVDTDDANTPYSEFARIAARAGVRHVVSTGMPLAQRSIGGMNIYQTAEGAFSPAFLEHAEVFANYAAVAVNNIASYADATNQAAHLRTAMQSRAVIEQAKGILMARDRCSPDEAFELLKRISQHRNAKLRDIAQTIVDSIQK